MIWFFNDSVKNICASGEDTKILIPAAHILKSFFFCLFLIGISCDLCINGHICFIQIEEKETEDLI